MSENSLALTPTDAGGASISKVFAAIGAMKLVRGGRFKLDDDIRTILKFPAPWKTVRMSPEPTVARIMQHRAGFNVGGFDGYATSRVPTLDEILKGSSSRSGVSVNSPTIEIYRNPGTWEYSGGGYQVLQKLMEERTGEPFESWMWENVLKPYGMSNSFFSTSIPSEYIRDNNVASGHDRSGNPRSPRLRRYPEAAAAGLYSTAEDIARMIIGVNRALASQTRSTEPIFRAQARTMMAQGLGFRTSGGSLHQRWFPLLPWRHKCGLQSSVLWISESGRRGGRGCDEQRGRQDDAP